MKEWPTLHEGHKWACELGDVESKILLPSARLALQLVVVLFVWLFQALFFLVAREACVLILMRKGN